MACYSFESLMNAPFEDIKGKEFIRLDTGEIIGSVYATYPNDCGKLSAAIGNGCIEFILRGNDVDDIKKTDKITKIFGIRALHDVLTFKEYVCQ